MGTEVGPVGRRTQRDRLAEAVADVAIGRGATVVLLGEAGMGKSLLLDDVAAEATQAGLRTLRTTCHQTEQHRPLGPLRDLPSLQVGRSQPDPVAEGPEPAFRAADDLTDRVLDVAVEEQGLALLLDDAHWADDDTLRSVRSLARRGADHPLLLVIAARPTPASPQLARLLADPSPSEQVLRLPPLDEDEVATVVQRLLGAPPAPDLRRLLQGAAGNPFYVIEVLQQLRERDCLEIGDVVGLADGAALDIAPLRSHVAAVLADLGEDARRVIRLASITDMSGPMLAALTDQPAATLGPAIDEGLASGLLVDRDGVVGLRHDLIRNAVRATIPEVVQAGIHHDLLAYLRPRGVPVEQLVPHLLGSSPGHDPAVVQRLAATGRELLDRSPASALVLLEAAYARGAADVAPDVIFAAMVAGDLDRSEQVAARVLAEGPVSARTVNAVAQLRLMQGRLREAAEQLLSSAEGLADPAERHMARADAGFARLLMGELDPANALASQAGVAWPEGPLTIPTAAALSIRGWVAALRGDLPRGLALTRSAQDVAAASPRRGADRNLPDYFHGQVLVWADQPVAARQVLAQGLERTRELGLGWALPAHYAAMAELALGQGRLDDARAEAEAGLSYAADTGRAHGTPWCLGILARVSLWRGEDHQPWLQRVERAVGRLDGQGADVLLWATAADRFLTGDPRGACDLLGLLWDRLAELGVALRQVQIAPDLLAAANAVGDHERVTAVGADLCTVVGRNVRPWPRADAVLALAEGMRDDDVASMRDAAGAFRSIGDPVAEGQALQQLAAIHQAAGRSTEASRAAAEAERLLLACGATRLVEVSPVPVRSGGATPVSGWAALTPSEERVVRLVAEGLTNADIAERLSVSRRTVESHLYRSYPKLELSSRVELAVQAATHYTTR